ncbi:DUF4026 domain-containing protein [Alysiella crassa]|uniref:Uncharacterized protein conserved in bacteria (DUF2314) n=1 Tax=Alysiella crassa TaxID=153491 RepID=A0A376BLU5_9NEIS|nr:DUF4026 domain-containing protein [Alysiella crassa]UOP07187.1 DUF4026 domain-containing protein [Alysiella crassa]SSY70650.1 Uncharacterized protein conserved in bacteria (DUF2314) [Alysiella crassa]
MSYSANLSIYDDLKNGDYAAPSIYLAAMKNRLPKFDVATIEARLQKVLAREDVDELVAVEASEDGQSFMIVFSSQDEDEDGEVFSTHFMFEVRLHENTEPEEWAYEAAEYRNRNLLEDERMEMHQATQILECLMYVNEDWGQTHVLLQYAVMDAIAGECYALQDLVSSQFFSGTWLAEMAKSLVPPSPEIYYVIHVITSDEQPNDIWMHTHGLLKFGLPELEALRVRRDQVSCVQQVMSSLANCLLDNPKIWQQDEAFTIAQSEQQEIAVRLMAWQDALKSDALAPMKKGLFKQKMEPFSGDLSEREDGDIHTEPSMVILADMNGKVMNFSELGDLLVHEKNHMMTMMPNSETMRMFYQAKEKLPLFAGCLKRHAPEEGKWGYMMKIRCESDSTEAAEHMWFTVHAIDDDSVSATLENEPFNIPEMKAGEKYTLPLENAVDWRIYSTPLQASIAPDDAYRLRRYLNAN